MEKPIVYPGVKPNLYTIDEFGRVYSFYKNDYKNARPDKDGYLHINLSGGSRDNIRDVKIATLVAYHFIGAPPSILKDPTVNHIDGNILNNHYTNLEWIERGLNSSIRNNKGGGEANHEAVLTEKQVKEICDLLVNTDLTYDQIADKYGTKKSTISNIKNKKNWTKISKDYDFNCRQVIRENGRFKTINLNLHKECE